MQELYKEKNVEKYKKKRKKTKKVQILNKVKEILGKKEKWKNEKYYSNEKNKVFIFVQRRRSKEKKL